MLESVECDQWTRVQAHGLQARVIPTAAAAAAVHHHHYIALHYIGVI